MKKNPVLGVPLWKLSRIFWKIENQSTTGIVAKLLSTLQDMDANMSIKLHFLSSHLDHFSENLGDLSDEQGERFHQDISEMEVRYQGRLDAAMPADYCWSIKRDDAFVIHSRRSSKRKFMADI